jgi:predicted ATPase
MKFFIRSSSTLLQAKNIPRPFALLAKNNWNDYSYTTLFQLYLYIEGTNNRVNIGQLKIMHLNQKVETNTFSSEIKHFDNLSTLGKEYCSIGNDLAYYENLKIIGDSLAINVLESLNDVSYDSNIRSRFEDDSCFNSSLLRYSETKEALDKGASLFGKKIIRQIKFSATIPIFSEKSYKLNFDFELFKGLPHRVNLLVGSNGVGKTQVMAKLAILLSRFAKENSGDKESSLKKLTEAGIIEPRPSLYNVIAVSFNAFDSFELPSIKQTNDFSYSYCGLRKSDSNYFNEQELAEKIQKFLKSMDAQKRQVAEEYLKQLLHYGDDEKVTSSSNYSALSAGQKIVLNILLHVLNKIKPQSLILLDEPETHLHPKLMTSLFMILTEILNSSDSFAIIATHSPIIVQQVPSRSIHVLKRIDNIPDLSSPVIECFGENLSEISRHVFQTSQSDRDYESIIDALLLNNNNEPEIVEELFDGKLGMNARIYLRSQAALRVKSD